MRKRVYKFTSAQHGISNLENKRLKISTIGDLNDPFDLCPLDTSDPGAALLFAPKPTPAVDNK